MALRKGFKLITCLKISSSGLVMSLKFISLFLKELNFLLNDASLSMFLSIFFYVIMRLRTVFMSLSLLKKCSADSPVTGDMKKILKALQML